MPITWWLCSSRIGALLFMFPKTYPLIFLPFPLKVPKVQHGYHDGCSVDGIELCSSSSEHSFEKRKKINWTLEWCILFNIDMVCRPVIKFCWLWLEDLLFLEQDKLIFYDLFGLLFISNFLFELPLSPVYNNRMDWLVPSEHQLHFIIIQLNHEKNIVKRISVLQ